MTAGAERDLLARAEDLADTADLAGQLTEIIGWARAARVDQAALAGLVTAVRVLDGDVTALFRAVRGRHQPGRFARDTDLLAITAEAEDDIAARITAAGQLRRQAGEALQRAQDDEAAADAALSCARAMHVTDPCQGCHGAKAAAIEAAQRDLEDARERGGYAGTALEVLAALKLSEVLRAVRRVPEDLREVYAAAYDLVTREPRAMPKDGDFITGQASPAAMAAQMLAARSRPPDPAGIGPAGRTVTRKDTP